MTAAALTHRPLFDLARPGAPVESTSSAMYSAAVDTKARAATCG
jgi:hypothetical protein